MTSKTLKDMLMTAENNKPKKTVSFNKFFPKDNAFVNVDGGFKDVDDWWVDVTIQADTKNCVNFWASDWKPQEQVKQLKATIEGAQKALDFIEACLKMQPVKKTPAKKK